MLQAIPRLVAEGVVVDAIVTDPPYHLTAIAERSKYKIDGAMARLLGGFMGQTWDGGDIAFRPETWATVGTIMRPGAFLVAFGGTRTHHRVWCAIEDAGFVIQDTIMWLFGSGFPKRRDMLKPAFEPICLAYKPGGKRTMQVDECRIGTDAGWSYPNGRGGSGWHGRESLGKNLHDPMKAEAGRWPANICHDGSDEVLAAFPCESGGGFGKRGGKRVSDYGFSGTMQEVGFGDSGSAARFFWSPKAGAEDRWGSRHPTVKPVELMRWLVQLVTPSGGLVLDPFAGSGTTGAAALATGRNAILIEREEAYVADIRERLAFYEGNGLHSLAAKARRTPDKPLGGLFDAAG
jgi:site-specific DNA-methyltransferase (adenine-specific)